MHDLVLVVLMFLWGLFLMALEISQICLDFTFNISLYD